MRYAGLVCALLCAVGAPVLSQQGPGRATLEGTVISAANTQVVPQAKVFLHNAARADDVTWARADQHGHFLFESVVPGEYWLSAEKTGFFLETRRGRSQPAFDLTAGSYLKDVLLRLTPLAVVTGQVLDERSEPVQRAQVTLLATEYRFGRPMLRPAGTAMSDDRGEYRVFNIKPGNYIVLADYDSLVQEWSEYQNIQLKGAQPPTIYPPVFYPGTSDSQQAQRIDLRPGDEIRIDFAFITMPLVSISGRVINGVIGARAANATVTAHWSDYVGSAGRSTAVSPDGSFEIRGVAPGPYTVTASFSDQDGSYSDQVTIEVGTYGARNVQLVPLPDFETVGRVTVESAPRNPPGAFAMDLMNENSAGISHIVAQQPFMRFTTRLHPGAHYRPSIPNLPQDYYLKSIRVSGREAPRNDIMISIRHSEIEVVLSPLGGHVEGVLLSDKDQPAPGCYVVLVPEVPNRIFPDLFRRVTTNSKGKFTIRGVPPGSYKLFAWEDVDLDEVIHQPEFLRKYENNGQTLKVEESGRHNVSLKLIAGTE